MTVLVQDPDLTIHIGDVRDVLPTLLSESVDCVATSPPFYGLRDYGTGEWDDGGDPGCDHAHASTRTVGNAPSAKSTLTTNSGRGPQPGDKYHESERRQIANSCPCGARRVDRQIGLEATPDEWAAELVRVFRECRRILRPAGTLWVECGDSYASGPYRDGESEGRHTLNGRHGHADNVQVAQRRSPVTPGTKPKDLIGAPWLLAFALRADGWYLRQALIWHKPNAMPESVRDRCTTAHSYVFLFSKQPRYWFDADAIAEPAAWERWGDQTTPKHEGTETAAGWIQPRTKADLLGVNGRNVQATNSEAERRRVVGGTFNNNPNLRGGDGTKNARSVWTIPTRGYSGAHFATWPLALAERILKAGCPDGGTVLDPFGGAGTTALVARRLGRRSVLVELNEEYARMAAERCSQLSLFADAPT